MKRYLLCLLLFVLVSCQRQVNWRIQPAGYLEIVQKELKDRLSLEDFIQLNIKEARSFRSAVPELNFLRIPFMDPAEFILLQTFPSGSIIKGKIVHLEGFDSHFKKGFISIQTLSRTRVMNSAIVDGYITALHLTNTRQNSLMPADLPDVTVIAYIHSGLSFSDMMLFQSVFYDSGGFGGSAGDGLYGPVGGSGGSGGGSGGGVSGPNDASPVGGVSTDPLVDLEPEYIYNIATVDIKKMFNCFDQVPSAGASYSIKLCTDIPSNNNPLVSANSSAASMGHSFLVVTKTNGVNSVNQCFGFYPQTTPSWYDPFTPVISVMKDNGAQEINASIQMMINEAQFNVIKQDAIRWSSKNYDLETFNCTDYALGLFNAVRSSVLTMAPFIVTLPGSPNPYNPMASPITVSFNDSPQMLFIKLQQMKNGNDPEAANIKIDQSHNTIAPISKGECQ